jgi:hypothetical protein
MPDRGKSYEACGGKATFPRVENVEGKRERAGKSTNRHPHHPKTDQSIVPAIKQEQMRTCAPHSTISGHGKNTGESGESGEVFPRVEMAIIFSRGKMSREEGQSIVQQRRYRVARV